MIPNAEVQKGVGTTTLSNHGGDITINCYGVEYQFHLAAYRDGAILVSTTDYVGWRYAKDVEDIDTVRYQDMFDVDGKGLMLYKGTMFTCHDVRLDGQLYVLVAGINSSEEEIVVSYQYTWFPYK